MTSSTHTPFGVNPFSTPRTPKGYKPLSSLSPSPSSSPDAEPVSPLARFSLRRAGGEQGLPSLRVWKETCKAFHVNTSNTPSSISSKTTILKNPNTNKSKSKPPTTATANRPYPPFERAMLLEDRDVFSLGAGASDEEGEFEFGDSFNVYAHATKRRAGGKKGSK